MTRRFVVGHNRVEGGALSIARLWRRSRGDNPGGGIASSAADQLRFARSISATVARNRSPCPAGRAAAADEGAVGALRGSSLGDAIGVGWFLREVDGVRTVGHGGSANGQVAELLTVPERDFVVVSLSIAGPDGSPSTRRSCAGRSRPTWG
jgi:Beta-lactamase